MKLLHTSDWHIGAPLHRHSRDDDFRHMADRIVEIVGREQPDLFLLCGDVYDTAGPSNASVRFFTETMVRLREAAPCMTVVVTAGNHDSASGHEVFRPAWALSGVVTVGRPPRTEADLDSCIVTVPGKCVVAAMPYANVNFSYLDTAALLGRVAEVNADGLPVVLTAHTSVAGCDFTGHDMRSRDTDDGEVTVVGNIESIPLSALGEGYDYCALGHIHRPQTLRGSKGRVRYCGTPMAVSFDETGPRSVSVVEIESRGARPVIREVEVEPATALVTLPHDADGNPLETDWDTALGLLSEFRPGRPTYVRLNIAQTDPLPPDYRQRALDACAPGARLCVVNSRLIRNEADRPAAGISASEFQSIPPVEIARRFYADNGLEFGDVERQLFAEVMQRLETKKRDS